MPQGGQANITVIDGGSATVNVPGSSVQLVIGTSSAGTVGQIIATRSAATLATYLGVGPLPEAAAMPCQAGGTVIAIKATTVTPGTSSTVTANQGTGASAGTSVVTLTGTPVDTYYLKVLVTVGGTVGTAGCSVQVSLDAGRNYGPSIPLGSATVLALGTTGLTLNFAAGTLIAGNFFTAGTTEPLTNTAGVLAALLTFQASPYAIGGVGSTHIVGALTGANSSVLETYLDNLATNYIYTRAFTTVRDASPAAMWGGTAETEAVWMTAIATDYSATSGRRIVAGAGYWNMPSAYPLPTIAGAPSYRRPISWAAAARQVTIPPQRHLGRVKDGSLSQIVQNPTTDPTDGFIYHNEAINPGLDYIINNGSGSRFMSTLLRSGLPGVYISNPLTTAPMGSDFYLMPYGTVMDIFSSIVHTAAQLNIDDDIRVNNNGTIYENDARNIEAAIAAAVNTGMFSTKMISSAIASGPTAAAGGGAVIVDRTINVRSLNAVNFTAQIVGKAYVLTINGSLSFQNPNAAV